MQYHGLGRCNAPIICGDKLQSRRYGRKSQGAKPAAGREASDLKTAQAKHADEARPRGCDSCPNDCVPNVQRE